MERLLVGVDGSEAAERALRWALDEARYRDAALHIVLVAEPVVPSGMPYPTRRDDAFEEAESELARIVDDVLGEESRVPVESWVEAGDPRQVLRELSTEADLLVVGSRGHGTVAGLLLGSVSQYLVTHAECPVTVVRA